MTSIKHIHEIPLTNQTAMVVSCSGFCPSCQATHALGEGNSRAECLQLMARILNKGRIDISKSTETADPRCTSSYLNGTARGKMFGVMECLCRNGETIFIYAFSGQYNGLWLVDGWAPPLFDVEAWQTTNYMIEKKIKEIGKEMEEYPAHSNTWKNLRAARRDLSRDLMKKIHLLYSIRNFKGENLPLKQLFPERTGIPNGTGDCCAPKLLNYAVLNDLTPLSMMEFYLGRENKSGTMQHGVAYPSCKDKCQPILGYMLCGLPKSLQS